MIVEPPDVLLLNNRGTHAAKAGEFALMALLMLAAQIPRIASAQREESGKLVLTLHGRAERLRVSPLYAHLFKQM